MSARQWRESEHIQFIWRTQFGGCILLPGRQCQDKVVVGAQWFLSCYPKLLIKSRYRNRPYWSFLCQMRTKGKIVEPTWLWMKVHWLSSQAPWRKSSRTGAIVETLLGRSFPPAVQLSFCRAKPDFLQQKTAAKTPPPLFPCYLS